MKRFAAFLLLSSVILSCQENDTEPANTRLKSDDFVYAKVNGDSWEGEFQVQKDSESDTLTFFGIASPPNDEVLGMRIKFEGPGTYALIKRQGFYYTTIGGDVFLTQYGFDAGSEGHLVITKYDEAENVIEGTFELSLNKEWTYSGDHPAVLNFKEGSFKGNIK